MSSAICGGVISKSLFDSNPEAYMMSYFLPDKQFERYVKATKKGDNKKAKQIFDKYAYSAI